jgi:hypothetical protein
VRDNHLTEDGRAHLQRDVVLGDDRLLVAGHRELADVDLLHPVDEGRQDVQARLVDRLELAEALDHADAPLLYDLDEAGREQGHHPDGRQGRHDDDPHHLSGRREQNHGVPL